jgi:CBS domain-containing protein
MRSAPKVFSPDLPIAIVLRQADGSGFDAWPVADAEGLWGMIRTSELEQAADDGASNQRLAEFLHADSWRRQADAEDPPHVHPDHTLSVALERMGATGLNVLPVVSRANVRQLIGIVTLDDILDAYGVAKRGSLKEPSD